MLTWIDSHCHLSPALEPHHRSIYFQKLIQAGCVGLVLGGIDPIDWRLQLDCLDQGLHLVPIFGLHPWTIQDSDKDQLSKNFQSLEDFLPKAQGLGECGLDFYRSRSKEDRFKQVEWFETQLDLAERSLKPCVFHIVRAHKEALHILKQRKHKIRGMVHSFWASPKIATEYLDLGLILSLHPRIAQNDQYQLLQLLPKESLVFESDSPQKLNNTTESDPCMVLEILQQLAKIWDEDIKTVCARQSHTLAKLFPSLLPLIP